MPMYSTPTLSATLPNSEPACGGHGRQNYLQVLLIMINMFCPTSPDPNNHTYYLRSRRHELTLTIKGDAKNVFERQLFKDIY